jgi:hypothetical protein
VGAFELEKSSSFYWGMFRFIRRHNIFTYSV